MHLNSMESFEKLFKAVRKHMFLRLVQTQTNGQMVKNQWMERTLCTEKCVYKKRAAFHSWQLCSQMAYIRVETPGRRNPCSDVYSSRGGFCAMCLMNCQRYEEKKKQTIVHWMVYAGPLHHFLNKTCLPHLFLVSNVTCFACLLVELFSSVFYASLHLDPDAVYNWLYCE